MGFLLAFALFSGMPFLISDLAFKLDLKTSRQCDCISQTCDTSAASLSQPHSQARVCEVISVDLSQYIADFAAGDCYAMP